MGIAELVLISAGLAMDAFAVSICKGLSLRKFSIKYSITAGLYFGIFQAVMPVAGYLAGSAFSDMLSSVDHWIVFILLCFIGGKMIYESRKCDEDEIDPSFGFRSMIALAIATSIDALAVGVSFAFLDQNIIFAAAVIGIITFVISAAGAGIGNFFGSRFKSRAELAGGLVLVLIGIKILADHMINSI